VVVLLLLVLLVLVLVLVVLVLVTFGGHYDDLGEIRLMGETASAHPTEAQDNQEADPMCGTVQVQPTSASGESIASVSIMRIGGATLLQFELNVCVAIRRSLFRGRASICHAVCVCVCVCVCARARGCMACPSQRTCTGTASVSATVTHRWSPRCETRRQGSQ
jgi:hypothetical protein